MEIKFNKPIYHPSSLDGVEVVFPYTCIEGRDIAHSLIKATITGSVVVQYGVQIWMHSFYSPEEYYSDLYKVMFQYVLSALKTKTLKELKVYDAIEIAAYSASLHEKISMLPFPENHEETIEQ